MKTDIILNELFDDAALQECLESITSTEGGFVSTSELIGLDRKTDFKNSNLRNVDFSYSDLRGFDFSGADLRFSQGIDVLIDETTILNEASVGGSIFEKRVREEKLFNKNKSAIQLYEALKQGDPYDVSSWISTRGGSFPPKLMQGIDETDRDILCQKLIVDDIDLTKRTTLFYHLRDMTSDQSKLHAVVTEFVAFHLDNASIIRAFVKVAGELFAKDDFISSTILKLCAHKDAAVREIAFISIAETKLFTRLGDGISKLFLLPKNADVRKKIILETAIRLGHSHVLAINNTGLDRDVAHSSVLDFDQIFERDEIAEVSRSQGKRLIQQSERDIREKQEEVLANAPFFSQMLELLGSSWLNSAKSRTAAQRGSFERYIESKIDNAYRRSRGN